MQITSGSLAGAFEVWRDIGRSECSTRVRARDRDRRPRRPKAPPDLRRGRDLAAARLGEAGSLESGAQSSKGVLANDPPSNLPLPPAFSEKSQSIGVRDANGMLSQNAPHPNDAGGLTESCSQGCGASLDNSNQLNALCSVPAESQTKSSGVHSSELQNITPVGGVSTDLTKVSSATEKGSASAILWQLLLSRLRQQERQDQRPIRSGRMTLWR